LGIKFLTNDGDRRHLSERYKDRISRDRIPSIKSIDAR